ncbi:MAG TPA: DNA-deoxyinosine glycosylase [Prolixibacteraceae bacterium]
MKNEIQKIDSPIYSFAPIADSNSKVLILGTMPGKESLRMTEYYAHPQNAFWKIIFALHNIPFSTDYQAKRELLLKNGIALWDVLRNCERKSSLDTDIKMEEPNDLRTFLASHPGISKIFFNGKGASRYFSKYFTDISLPIQILPSTSPAHAVKWDHKLAIWQVIKIT